MAVAPFSNASIKPIGALLHQLNPLEKSAYFADVCEELVEAGLLGPVPESQAVSVTTVATSNNKWLTIFIDFFLVC